MQALKKFESRHEEREKKAYTIFSVSSKQT